MNLQIKKIKDKTLTATPQTINHIQHSLDAIRSKIQERIDQSIQLERVLSMLDKIIRFYIEQENDLLQQLKKKNKH